jgi:hypothetical protein
MGLGVYCFDRGSIKPLTDLPPHSVLSNFYNLEHSFDCFVFAEIVSGWSRTLPELERVAIVIANPSILNEHGIF